MTYISKLRDFRRGKRRIYFTKAELTSLLQLYSMRVATGEWRDYAIDHEIGLAAFSIFRHTTEGAAYSVVKLPVHGSDQFDFVLFDMQQQIAKSRSLFEILPLFPSSRSPLSLVTS